MMPVGVVADPRFPNITISSATTSATPSNEPVTTKGFRCLRINSFPRLLWLAPGNYGFGLGLPNHLRTKNMNKATKNIPPIIPPTIAQGTAAAPDVGVGVGVGLAVGVVAGVVFGVISGVGVGVAVVSGSCSSPP